MSYYYEIQFCKCDICYPKIMTYYLVITKYEINHNYDKSLAVTTYAIL